MSSSLMHLWAVYFAFANIKIISQAKYYTLDLWSTSPDESPVFLQSCENHIKILSVGRNVEF